MVALLALRGEKKRQLTRGMNSLPNCWSPAEHQALLEQGAQSLLVPPRNEVWPLPAQPTCRSLQL